MSIRQTYLVTEGEQMNEKQRQEVTEGESVVRMGIVQKQKQARKTAQFKGFSYVCVCMGVPVCLCVFMYVCICIYMCLYLDVWYGCMCVCVCV